MSDAELLEFVTIRDKLTGALCHISPEHVCLIEEVDSSCVIFMANSEAITTDMPMAIVMRMITHAKIHNVTLFANAATSPLDDDAEERASFASMKKLSAFFWWFARKEQENIDEKL